MLPAALNRNIQPGIPGTTDLGLDISAAAYFGGDCRVSHMSLINRLINISMVSFLYN